MGKKIVYSGVQPSGDLTIGNYLGSVSHFAKLQEEYECLFNVADMHSLTVTQDPVILKERIYKVLATFLASGIDPEKSIVFVQSDCSEHAELCWVLNSITYMGQLSRMTQFKDKSQKHEDNINAALFTYPVLMAADILLYNTDLVPVGEDQRQHIEITRDLAIRFNNRFGDTFVVPEGLYGENCTRVMSLKNPEAKMSKSDADESAFIRMLDEPDTIIKKIKTAVTDSLGVVKYSPEQAGLRNLLDIYSGFSNEDIDTIVSRYEGKGYGVLKKDLGDLVVQKLDPIRKSFYEYMNDKAYLEKTAAEGARKASEIAGKTLSSVYEKVGLKI